MAISTVQFGDVPVHSFPDARGGTRDKSGAFFSVSALVSKHCEHAIVL